MELHQIIGACVSALGALGLLVQRCYLATAPNPGYVRRHDLNWKRQAAGAHRAGRRGNRLAVGVR